MIKITVCDWPYSEHGTKAKHEYCLDKDIYEINHNKEKKKVFITFDSCADMLVTPVDNLKSITIEEV